MELKDLLDNPDYVNANTATRKAIFEKYSKNSPDYVSANDETRQVIHQRFGLGGVNVTQPLPEKFSDFTARDVGNFVGQSFSEANKQLAKTGRTPVVGPAVLGAVGETIKGIGAIGELATDRAQGITKVGQALTQGAQEANAPAAMVGQVGSYIAPYKLAQKGIQATAGKVPYVRGAVNPATFLGSTGEMAGAGALVGGLTTPGGYDERMKEAATQALFGGGANAAIRGGIGAYQTGKGLYQGGRNAIDQQFGTPNARSAFTEVGEKVYPSSAADPFVKLSAAERADPARLAALEASQVPTPSLFQSYPQKFAYNLAETGPTGGKLIPNQGASLAEAFGEQTMRNFQKPVTDLSGIGGNLAGAVGGALAGSAFAPGIGTLLGAGAGFVAPQIKRGLELIKLSQLRGAANLNPEFASALQNARSMAASQINPAAAQTPAAQAAVATTAAKVAQTTPQIQPQPIPQAAPPVAPPVPTKAQRMAEPNANTPLIDQALQQRIAADPTLTGFDKSYVIPQAIKQPVENFLNNTTKHAVVYGGPGTGKTSLAGEWQARNPDGNMIYLDPKSFNKKQADLLKDASLTQNKILYVIDEADKFTPAQITHLTNLMDATKGNSKVLATTNDLSKVSKDLKTNEFAQIKVDTQLTPQERSAFALNVARQYNVNKTPADIEAIANNPALKNFRDIKREVSKGYTIKEEPMMSAGSLKGRVDLPDNLITLLDDFNNNQTPKNLIIVDKTAFTNSPQLSDKIDRAGTSLTMDKVDSILPKTLARSNTASPTYIIDIRNADDASKISALKGLIERSNETAYPTKIIIKDRLGQLDPALYSRAEVIDKSYFKNKDVDVAKAILRGEDLGIVKSPKAQPEVKYNTPAEMRRALFGTMPEAQMEAKIAKAFPKKGK